MTHARRMTAVLLAGTVAAAAGACGGSSKQPAKTTASQGTTPTDTTTTDTTSTSTTATGGKAHKRPSLGSTPARTLTFSGTGIKDIGKPSPLKIPTNSTIKWTNDGQLFQLIPASIKVPSPVNSRDHSGEAKIRKGAYYGFLVNAIGHWTISIVPG